MADNGTIAAHTEDGNTFYFDASGKAITEAEFKARQIKNPNWKMD
ncbi:MAG: hypothetical protein V4580_18860 [Bacteroidota bacterium]